MKKLFTLLGTLGVLMTPAFAFAQEAPPEGLDALAPLIEAAQGGKWSLFASLLIMLLVWLATKAPVIKDWIKGEALIWTAAVAGMLAAFAASVYLGHTEGAINWVSAILEGLSVGLAAGGLWSLIGRKIGGKSVDADGDGVLDEGDDIVMDEPDAPSDDI